jgi:C_GCAxxG_C_C family probable redox protein
MSLAVTHPSTSTRRAYRRRSTHNMIRMGHCAPTVLRTILDVDAIDKSWAVKLSAGMPGGIGNTGAECGAVTSPLVVLGLRHGLRTADDGLPVILHKGHDYCERFTKCNGTLFCREIRTSDRIPTRCPGVVRRAGELYAETVANDGTTGISGERYEAYRQLHAHWMQEGFHCAHAVLLALRDVMAIDQEVLDATSAFMGGTLFKGLTCSALAGGVMAVGLKSAEIEDSPLRVLRMAATMIAGGDAMADRLNKFNRIIHIGEKMAKSLAEHAGSIQCRAITQCDFATTAGVKKYVDARCVDKCRTIAAKVAEMVRGPELFT